MGKRKTTRDSKKSAGSTEKSDQGEIMNSTANDENAINREIATLLLNLHSSTGRQSTPTSEGNSGHAEDLSTKKVSQDSAIDLSKNSSGPKDAKVAALGKSSGMPNSSSLISTATTSEPNFSFYPSLASMAGLDSSSIPGLNSSYLLQNLLIGKMHQLAGGKDESTEQCKQEGHLKQLPPGEKDAGNSLAFPTQPLPAQALSLATPQSLKPPVSVLKSIPSATAMLTSVTSSSSPKDSVTGTVSASAALDTSTGNNIPLLCGQIVAQLNGLLFLVHGLSDPQIELSLQTQLGAIFTRLQELVSIVEQAKSVSKSQAPSESVISAVVGAAKSSEDPEGRNRFQQERTAPMSHEMAGLMDAKAHTDFNNAKHIQGLQPIPVSTPNGAGMHPEVESTSNVAAAALVAAARRRRGRPPKGHPDGVLVSHVGGEKRAKLSEENAGVSSLPSSSTSLGGGTVALNGNAKSAGSGGSGGGGKGIRNRVFCGECIGCLKNDDCGRCRYCKDKTKFGGQNRLRQKCLHRRCQMDTHRRRPSASGKSSGHGQRPGGVLPSSPDDQAMAAATLLAATVLKNSNFSDMMNPTSPRSPSPNAIYSGVDLARLAASNTTDRESNGVAAAEGNRLHGVNEDDGMASGCKNNVSRIDKWKAKHEAMLKLAEGKHSRQANSDKNNDGNNVGAVHDEDEDEEEIEVGEEEKKKTISATKSPEIPDIDPTNGVVIELHGGDAEESDESGRSQQNQLTIAASAMHPRSTDVRVQHVLSV